MPEDSSGWARDSGSLAAALALAHPSRQSILRALEAAPEGLAVAEIAASVGLKHNAVRKHLRLMELGGFVRAGAPSARGRGRPAGSYRLVAREDDGRHELARLLVGMVVASGMSEDQVEEFGRLEGRTLVEEAAGAEAIVRVLERLGFAPVPAESASVPLDLRMSRCPFRDAVVAPGGRLVCVLHRGLSAGLAERALNGGRLDAFEIDDPQLARCRVVLDAARCEGSPHRA